MIARLLVADWVLLWKDLFSEVFRELSLLSSLNCTFCLIECLSDLWETHNTSQCPSRRSIDSLLAGFSMWYFCLTTPFLLKRKMSTSNLILFTRAQISMLSGSWPKVVTFDSSIDLQPANFRYRSQLVDIVWWTRHLKQMIIKKSSQRYLFRAVTSLSSLVLAEGGRNSTSQPDLKELRSRLSLQYFVSSPGMDLQATRSKLSMSGKHSSKLPMFCYRRQLKATDRQNELPSERVTRKLGSSREKLLIIERISLSERPADRSEVCLTPEMVQREGRSSHSFPSILLLDFNLMVYTGYLIKAPKTFVQLPNLQLLLFRGQHIHTLAETSIQVPTPQSTLIDILSLICCYQSKRLNSIKYSFSDQLIIKKQAKNLQ